MNLKEFISHIEEGQIKAADIPMLALCILCAVIVIVGWIGCIIWFLGTLVFALVCGASKLLMLIPCIIIFSILSAIIWWFYMSTDSI